MKFLLSLLLATSALAASWVGDQPQPGGFALVANGKAATIVTSPEDFKVVSLAANDLAADLQRVTGVKPAVAAFPSVSGPAVLIGTLGESPLINGLVDAGKLDVKDLAGAWESFVITTVTDPLPNVASALVIVGSDRRGTAFGVYELSQAIGVSPWYWWTDVTPAKKSALHVAAGTRRFGPPSVQYRGIFINDEDWGLQPWAAKTFEPETGDLGPKTYAKVCELLLRLKANTLWPGMHPSTKAFNHYPKNKQVADDYAIVMGSSHAEPMLRNNVGEWTAPKEDYNYITNRDGVRAYWEQRVKENGKFENIYTLGMRGIHDSNMVGPKTDAERIATLERIFADQRALIAKYVRPDVASVPQMFCAYKEVLALYRQGLKVPDDVTIVWPDDNFGYVRNFATPEERRRPGGFGVYYHISYLGAPLSYLWLSTTPPALIWSEMSKAYDHGARKIWIVNVGDIKPGEIGTEFFLQMAWDIKRWRHDNVADFLPEWAAREFGPAVAPAVARVMETYYQLNFARRPEHLQWWLRNEAPRPSPLSRQEIDQRITLFSLLAVQAADLESRLRPGTRDAYHQLVGYPVLGSALANFRYFYGELGDRERALAADAQLKEFTRHYNEDFAGGKWRGLTSLEPADKQFQSMRVYPWSMPDFRPKPAKTDLPGPVIAAARSTTRTARGSVAWENIPGLGVGLLPTTAPSFDPAKLLTDAPRLDYLVDFPAAGEWRVTFQLLPTHPITPGRGLRLGVGLGENPPQPVAYTGADGSAEWAQGVLNNYVTTAATLAVPSAGKRTLRVYGVDPGVVLREIRLDQPLRSRTIATHAWAGSSVNVLANQNSTLVTASDAQYAAFYDADRRLVLARRPLGSEGWQTQVTPYTGNVADAHNTVALAVDGAGYLHVAWDHHAQPLNYARGTAPGSLELGPKQSMTGSLEELVTYPMFFRQPDGGLLFLYRDGRSGRGNIVLNRYDATARTWRRLQDNLIDGEGARSAYLAATVDDRGTLHLAWNWRDSPDVATNHDLCYAKSADGGVTWTTSTGARLALPLTAANAEYALKIPPDSRLMNPPSLTTDAAGRPCIASYWAAAGSDVPQFHVVRHDGQAWTVTQVTSRTTPFELRGGGTKRPPISRAAIVAGEKSFHLVYRDDERGGRIVAVSTDNLAQPLWRTRELTTASVGAWEPSLDAEQWTRQGEIHLLVQAVEQQDGNDRVPKSVPPTPISTLVWKP
ncbi:MAG TPA: glycosyl hydrolase 115 family protein [Lacunisphaera sp.]